MAQKVENEQFKTTKSIVIMLTLTKIVEQDEEVLRHMLKIDTLMTHSKDDMVLYVGDVN